MSQKIPSTILLVQDSGRGVAMTLAKDCPKRIGRKGQCCRATGEICPQFGGADQGFVICLHLRKSKAARLSSPRPQ